MNNFSDKSNQELQSELNDLRLAYELLKSQCESGMSVLRDAEAKAKMSEEKFMKAFMTSPDSVNINRLSDGMYVSVNEGFVKMLGFSEGEVIGKTSLELNIWADPDNRKDLVSRLQKDGRIENFEALFRHKDGRIIIGLMSASILDLDGVPHSINITKDITGRKQIEDQFFLLANALKGSKECVSITDMNDNVLFLNRAFLETYGFNEEDLKDESISIIRSPNNPPEIVNEILPATLRGGWHGEIYNRKKDGTDFLISLSTGVVKDENGKPVALIGIASDITQSKRIELENQILYEINRGITLTSNLDELLKLIHLSLGKVVYAENFFVALINEKSGLFSFPYFVDKYDTTPLPTSMGKSCSSYVFRTVKPFLFSQKEFEILEKLNEVELVGSPSPSWIGIPLQTPSGVLGVMVLQHYEKENVYSEEDMRFLVSIGGQIAFAIERKLAELEIKLKNELLQTVNSEKDKFFSILAHDLRGPLSAFVEATKIITEEVHTMSIDEIKEITLSMTQSATGIYSLLENLLEWSRLQRGVMNFIPEKINIKQRIIDCVNVLSESAKKKGIVIETSMDETLEINADKHMFDTIVRNLISNALKFTKQGGIVSISAIYARHDFVEIKISDSGIGMTTELINKLFRIDEKTSRPGTDGEPSTGLGLLLCKEFIEKHGGKIWVTSEAGKGSIFTFSLAGAQKS
ncbi:MAG: PAS domain S-box protein [Bacteroidales bacterium]|nr:PAS domain S-box protein [Bacteroidales bacterium]